MKKIYISYIFNLFSVLFIIFYRSVLSAIEDNESVVFGYKLFEETRIILSMFFAFLLIHNVLIFVLNLINSGCYFIDQDKEVSDEMSMIIFLSYPVTISIFVLFSFAVIAHSLIYNIILYVIG